VSVILLRGDARELPLADESVDLIVTSVPYWGQRDYQDGGESLSGQIGNEDDPLEYVAALLDCTREWARVLKSTGSMFVNIADSYYSGKGNPGPNGADVKSRARRGWVRPSDRPGLGYPRKTLLGLPARYEIGCIDDLGLIVRRDNIWHKTNPIPESAGDRCATKHEYLFHLVKQPRYYSAIDEVRETHSDNTHPGVTRTVGNHSGNGVVHRTFAGNTEGFNPLGKLPGSVWEIPSQPLIVPAHLGVDHFAAFPMELPRRCILGWSPCGICLECGEGRRPVTTLVNIADRKGRVQRIVDYSLDAAHGPDGRGGERWRQTVRIIGYSCSCTPYTDHPGSDKTATRRQRAPEATRPQGTYGRKQAGEYERVGPWREYHLDEWRPPPTRTATVADPFGGAGTTALLADALGRIGISLDRSADYCRLARWRTTDPAERAKALQVPKPPPVPDGQLSLLDGLGAAL
jgi:DNA modification methylase